MHLNGPMGLPVEAMKGLQALSAYKEFEVFKVPVLFAQDLKSRG